MAGINGNGVSAMVVETPLHQRSIEPEPFKPSLKVLAEALLTALRIAAHLLEIHLSRYDHVKNQRYYYYGFKTFAYICGTFQGFNYDFLISVK